MVCILSPAVAAALPDDTLQAVAAEVNLSETAFLTPDDGDDVRTATTFHLRWFTPTCEVPLCGHATLAASGVVFQHFHNPAPALSFLTAKAGKLCVRRDAAFGATGVAMAFPLNDVVPHTTAAEAVYAAIAAQVVGADRVDADVAELAYSPGTAKLLVRLADGTTRAQLEAYTPSQAGMHAIDQSALPPAARVRGVSLTCVADAATAADGVHFMSRYFTPWNGIPEDPVTGSLHTALAPFWRRRLALPASAAMVGLQASGRSGKVTVTVHDDDGTVTLGGCVTLFMSGSMRVPMPHPTAAADTE